MLFASRWKHNLLYIDLEKRRGQQKACHQKAAMLDFASFGVCFLLCFMQYETKENDLPQKEHFLWSVENRLFVFKFLMMATLF